MELEAKWFMFLAKYFFSRVIVTSWKNMNHLGACGVLVCQVLDMVCEQVVMADVRTTKTRH